MCYQPVLTIKRCGVFLQAVLLLCTTGYMNLAAASVDDFALRINVGGEAYTDNQGRQWSADTGFNTGRVSGSATGIIYSGTNDQSLYQSGRWEASAAPELRYSFDVPDGAYTVRLHFAESWSGTQGEGLRIFDVMLESELVLDNLDIFSEVGGNTALVKTLGTQVSDGTLDIEFLHQVQNPELRGLEIYANKPPVIAPIAAQSITPGQYFFFGVIAADPDGTPPVLRCVSCPQGAFFFENGLFAWSPSANTDTGELYQVVFQAVDALDPALTVERTAYITVVQNAPQLERVQDAMVREGETLELALNAATLNGLAALSAILFDAPLTSSLKARGAEARFERSSEASYYDKTGKLIYVPANTPRFLDNDQGVLIEGPRTNLVAPSINLGTGPWVDNFSGTAIDNYGIAPDGSKTSSLVVGNTSRFSGRKISVPLVPADHYESPTGRYALKVHLKAGSSQRSRHGVYNDTTKVWEGYVDLQWLEGVPRVTGSGNSRHIYLENTGYEGWWTLSFRFPEVNIGNVARDISDSTFFHIEPDRLGTSGTLEAWGAQLEAGFISTSYIHNLTDQPKSRAADLLTYDIKNFAPALPSNNIMVESEYFPQWDDREIRGWHPRLWGTKVNGSKIDETVADYSTYFLARTSRSSPNFVATRTSTNDERQQDVTLSREIG